MNLFSDNFPIIQSDQELENLILSYKKYDPAYIVQGAADSRQKTKLWMESIWKIYEPHADAGFTDEFKLHFTQRSWELYLGAALLMNNFVLGPRRPHGPDFNVCDNNNSQICWIEAISITKGEGNDRVPEHRYDGGVMNVPTEQILLRLTSGLFEKFQKYKRYLLARVVRDDTPFVIAIDRSELEHVDAILPNILKVLFGIGDLALRIRVNGKPVKKPDTSWTHLPTITKSNGEKIPLHFFDNPEHAGISAVIYSKDNIINSPRKIGHIGENLFIVHNPLAKNPLPHDFLPFGEIYIADDNKIKRIRTSKEYDKPDPFEFYNC